MKQVLPRQLQTHIGRALVRKERLNIQRHLSRKHPDQTLESYLKSLQTTHGRKQSLIQSIPIYAYLLEDIRIHLQTTTHLPPPPRIPERDIFGQVALHYLRQHIHSRKVFVGLHIRYFGYQLCFLFRDRRHLYVSMYQPDSDIQQDFVDLYDQITTETFQSKVIQAVRTHQFSFMNAYSMV